MSEKPILVSKAGGRTEPFDIEKLEHSLRRARVGRDIINKVTSHILQELEDGMSTHEIFRHAFEVLHRLETSAAIRYSLRRALLDLGPSGFPFERFVAEIFKTQGYKTLTDQIVWGSCVEHELDVVAWKHEPGHEPSLIMSEVKFHNQPGLKSDLKIVLYVKARFDDVRHVEFNYGGETMKLTETKLITNTKFTASALKYAECQGMNVIGWNYPLDGNLQDLIEEAKVHPLTCLHSLSDHDKKSLLNAGVVLCRTLEQDHEILHSLGLSQANIDAVMEEIKHIYIPRPRA